MNDWEIHLADVFSGVEATATEIAGEEATVSVSNAGPGEISARVYIGLQTFHTSTFAKSKDGLDGIRENIRQLARDYKNQSGETEQE